jgi:two-component system chemotaxis response regulator CheB
VKVAEAKEGDIVTAGNVLIAPGDKHMIVKRSSINYYVELRNGPLVCRQKPSVEVLFKSIAKSAGSNAVGIILTGMGNDGAEGLLEMRRQGAHTIAQDEKSSAVFGMPREAIRKNAAEKILSLEQIPQALIDFTTN